MSSFIVKAVGWLADHFLGRLIGKVAENAVQPFLEQSGDQDLLNNLQSSLQNAKIIVNTVDNMRIKDESSKKRLKELLLRLKDAAYDADDLLDEFQYRSMQQQIEQQGCEASNKRSSSSSFRSNFPPSKTVRTSVLSSAASRLFGGDDVDVIRMREIQGRLDKITADIKEVANFIDRDVDGRKQILSSESRRKSSISVETEIFGRDKELSALIQLLLKSVDASECSNHGISILTIDGIGGIGKTTLAQQAYGDERLENRFELKSWVCVSENFSVERLTREIIESATRQRCDLMSFDALQMVLKEKIASRRFLLVLDDVWNEDKDEWESLCSPLRSGVPGSKIVVTTRSTKISKMVGNAGAIHLDVLDENNYWELFQKCAFGGQNSGDHPHLEAIAKEIVPKLKGLPLAARTIGSLLNADMNEQNWKMIMKSEIWQLPQDDKGVLAVLQLSYQFLPAHLKQCFTLCSLFPKDYEFDEWELIRIWMAEGFVLADANMRMEDVGSKYFHELVSRSFFQKAKYYFKIYYVMHDLIHDLAQLISVGESYRMDSNMPQKIHSTIRHLSINFVNDAYERKLMEFPNRDKLRTLALPDDAFTQITFRSGHVTSVSREHRPVNCVVSPGLFESLKSIRVLILRYCSIIELPDSIGDLLHLRYFDITRNREIETIPNSLCNLCNMQTIVLSECDGLQSLPQGMSKLVNLRHIKFGEHPIVLMLISTITGVGKLTSLQELPLFKVSKEIGNKLVELRDLTQLRGRLRIMSLENVESKEEASDAKLKDKEFLEELILEWSPTKYPSSEMHKLHISEEVLEGLQPHQTLRSLTIREYNGVKPPGWLHAKALSSSLEEVTLENCSRWEDISFIVQLSHLKRLSLKGMPIEKQISDHYLFGLTYTNCNFFSGLERLVLQDLPLLEQLPNLGHFPCLESLYIWGMSAVKKIEDSFFGFTDQGKCFPKLRNLSLSNMPALEEWTWAEGKELFPLLHYLSICNCPKLKRLPPFPRTLLFLTLNRVGLTELPKLLEESNGSSGIITVSLFKVVISDCANLTSLEEGLLSHHPPNIEYFSVSNCKELVRIPVEKLISTHMLSINGCPRLSIMTKHEATHLRLSPTIYELSLSKCGDLIESLPSYLHNLISLTSLSIHLCPKIISLPIGPLVRLEKLSIQDCNELISLDGLHIRSLFRLVITGCPKLLLLEREEQGERSSLRELKIDNIALLKQSPLEHTLSSIIDLEITSYSQVEMFEGEEQGLLQSLTTLKYLTFRSCNNLHSLPKQLHALPSLELLQIFDCPHIESLPKKGLPKTLTGLSFSGCYPKLKEQLEKQVAVMKNSGQFRNVHYNGKYFEIKRRTMSDQVDYYEEFSSQLCLQ